MKLTFEEKKLLYTYGCANLELTRKRLCGVAGLTVDPDQNKLVLDFCRKLEDETLADCIRNRAEEIIKSELIFV